MDAGRWTMNLDGRTEVRRPCRLTPTLRWTTLPTTVCGLILAAMIGLPAADTFDERRKACLDAVWAYHQENVKKPGPGFNMASALFAMGRVDEARRIAHRSLDQFVPGNKENRWMFGGNSGFGVWPGIDCYIRHEDQLGDALKKRYRDIYTGGVFYPRLSTSNHKIMAAVTRYLATQVWGEAAFKPDPFFKGEHDNGSFFQANDRSGEKYVRSIIETTLKEGPGEYASRPYGAENLLPLLSIADCAKDTALRARARLAYEYCLIQFAPVWLRGHLATFSTRSYPDMMTQQPSGVAGLAWMYYGGVMPGGLARQWGLMAMLSDYRLPDPLPAIATDRAQSFVHRALINRWALYHWVDRSHVLFSRSPKALKPTFIGQNYPCGVMWDEPDTSRGSHLWITNPAADSATDPKFHPNGIHTHGCTNHETQVQRAGALLAVYDIPATFRHPYVLAYIPGGHRAVIDDSRAGRLFLHYGVVLIAITASKPFAWDPAAGLRASAGKPHAGDAEFRVLERRAAVAIETAHPADIPGADPQAQLAAFRDRIVAKASLSFTANGATPVGRYTDRDGHRLECAFAGEDRIDDQVVDYARWPALENPWMRQETPAGILTVTMDGRKRVYDFAAGTVTGP